MCSHKLKFKFKCSCLKSLNSHCPKGGNLIGGLKNILHSFRLGEYVVCFDLSRAYRSVFTTQQANDLRLMWWADDVAEAMKDLDGSMVGDIAPPSPHVH